MANQPIGKELSPILSEIHDALWQFEADHEGTRPGFTTEGFKGAIKIFVSALLEMAWNHQEQIGMSQEEREAVAQKTGEEIRTLVTRVTGIDPRDLYKN